MGFFSGITKIITAPVSVVSNAVKRACDEGFGVEDVLTGGLTKLAKGMQDTAKEIDEAFDEDEDKNNEK